MGYARGCFFQHPFFKLFSQHPSLKDNFFFLNFAVKISELDVIPDSVLDSVFYLMHCTFFFPSVVVLAKWEKGEDITRIFVWNCTQFGEA